jgi:hypothetical protein
MVQPDVAEIRKMLQVFDQSSSLSASQAVRMLKSITRNIAKDPEAFDLLTDPGVHLNKNLYCVCLHIY